MMKAPWGLIIFMPVQLLMCLSSILGMVEGNQNTFDRVAWAICAVAGTCYAIWCMMKTSLATDAAAPAPAGD